MLTKKSPDTFPARLKVETLGEVHELNVVYRNVGHKQLDKENTERGKPRTDAELLLRVVESWDAEFELTTEGIALLEEGSEDGEVQPRPGVVYGVVQGFFLARVAAVRKN